MLVIPVSILEVVKSAELAVAAILDSGADDDDDDLAVIAAVAVAVAAEEEEEEEVEGLTAGCVSVSETLSP